MVLVNCGAITSINEESALEQVILKTQETTGARERAMNEENAAIIAMVREETVELRNVDRPPGNKN
ncbi:hypothetical protein T12_10007 [Trichinella patagoniensis]|uniref:Uncharacterized protein n=1 Tax=Trichinella patagoniensis TaxID=990121 RepID=A0A0V1A5N9_9BILA|nr:hypothetical protein T12_10007 [Trichinella patagoniensis]